MPLLGLFPSARARHSAPASPKAFGGRSTRKPSKPKWGWLGMTHGAASKRSRRFR